MSDTFDELASGPIAESCRQALAVTPELRSVAVIFDWYRFNGSEQVHQGFWVDRTGRVMDRSTIESGICQTMGMLQSQLDRYQEYIKGVQTRCRRLELELQELTSARTSPEPAPLAPQTHVQEPGEPAAADRPAEDR